MKKTKQGLSNAAYGKLRGLSGAYIGRLVKAGKIPTLPNGRIDPEVADEARARNVAPRVKPGDWNRPVNLEDIEQRIG